MNITKDLILDALNSIDDDIVVRHFVNKDAMTVQTAKRTNPLWLRWTALVACIAVVALSAFAVLPRLFEREPLSITDNPPSIIIPKPYERYFWDDNNSFAKLKLNKIYNGIYQERGNTEELLHYLIVEYTVVEDYYRNLMEGTVVKLEIPVKFLNGYDSDKDFEMEREILFFANEMRDFVGSYEYAFVYFNHRPDTEYVPVDVGEGTTRKEPVYVNGSTYFFHGEYLPITDGTLDRTSVEEFHKKIGIIYTFGSKYGESYLFIDESIFPNGMSEEALAETIKSWYEKNTNKE